MARPLTWPAAGDTLVAMKRVLLLAELGSVALPVMRALGSRGMIAGVAGAGDGTYLRVSRHCASYARIAADAREMAEAGEAVLEAAARAAREFGPDLILPADVPGAFLAAKLKGRVAGPAYFPSPEPAALRVLDNKWSFHEFLVERGLPSPKTRLLDGAGAAAAADLPLVIKPLSGSGGQGVTVVRTADELAARLEGGAFPLLAQEFVAGEDVDLSFLADRGTLLAWAVQMRSPGGSIRYIDDERVVELGRRLAAATAYTGMAHFDMRYDGPARERILIIECNPRFWATFSNTAGLGVDFIGLGLELARGRSPAPIAASPVGPSLGVRDALGKLMGGGDLSADNVESIRQKLLDPGPELYKTGRRLLGSLRG